MSQERRVIKIHIALYHLVRRNLHTTSHIKHRLLTFIARHDLRTELEQKQCGSEFVACRLLQTN